jgi:hypothetical protein
MDQILNGAVRSLIESKAHLLINGNADEDKIKLVKSILEGYEFAHTVVSVSNKVSRLRNESRGKPLNEQTRIRKWLDAEKSATNLENTFVFKNSINLREATQNELADFQNQIEEYLNFLVKNEFMFEDKVVIHAPEFKHVHGKEARVFYRHSDGRINVQVQTGHRARDVNNYTLKPGQWKEMNEVLEWGTDETVKVFKAATPGETASTNPKLTVRQLKSRLKVPPNAYDSRIGGVDPTGGLQQGGSWTGAPYAGGLVS